MNTFPYDSWEEALDAAGGYFTWGTGGNLASVILSILGIVLSLVALIQITRREDADNRAAAERLAAKWNN